MDQRAVVGEQQHAGRVFVEPADRLHAAPAQRRRQQAQHARMVARLAASIRSRAACAAGSARARWYGQRGPLRR